MIESGDSKRKWEKQPFLPSSHHPLLPPTQGATANRNGALNTQRKASQECSDLIALHLLSTRLSWTTGRRIGERGLETLGRPDLKKRGRQTQATVGQDRMSVSCLCKSSGFGKGNTPFSRTYYVLEVSSVVLKLDYESPGGFVNTQIARPHPQSF